jgi:hypothetical protein
MSKQSEYIAQTMAIVLIIVVMVIVPLYIAWEYSG